MNKTYVEFFYPGSFVSETEVREVPNRDAPLEVPEAAFGYRFFDRYEAVIDGEQVRGDRKNFSGMTYFGEVMTLADVQAKVPDSQILQSNMRCNGWERVVRTRRGNFQPLNAGDTVKGQHERD